MMPWQKAFWKQPGRDKKDRTVVLLSRNAFLFGVALTALLEGRPSGSWRSITVPDERRRYLPLGGSPQA